VFAKNLEYLLLECCDKSDVSRIDPADMAARFDSLRGYGRLPRGRENRAKHLNAAEIAAAIFGLVPFNPNWAGHAATLLSNLRPVDGPGASLHGAVDLLGAVEGLLTNSRTRQCLHSLTLSTAESGVNCNGFANLIWKQDETDRQVVFGSEMRALRPNLGAPGTLDALHFRAPVSRCIVFNRAFFESVAIAVARAVAVPAPPAGDGSEYDAEEDGQARYKALGVRRGSRFLNIGVDTQVTWPDQEMLVPFDEYHLVLMPKTVENAQSIHVDLQANRLTNKQAVTLINRFLSVLAWCDDQFAIAQDGWSGNPVPVAVPRRDLAFITAHDWPFDRRLPESDEARRALALYREGRNAEEAALVSYAVLSYFKIIEIKHPNGKKAKKWIAGNFESAVSTPDEDARMKDFSAACASEAPEDYIYDACRVAVAHASIKHPSDADDSDEITRLYSASYVLRLLARRLIAEELGVSDSPYSGDRD
jgi:hypothetical protein